MAGFSPAICSESSAGAVSTAACVLKLKASAYVGPGASRRSSAFRHFLLCEIAQNVEKRDVTLLAPVRGDIARLIACSKTSMKQFLIAGLLLFVLLPIAGAQSTRMPEGAPIKTYVIVRPTIIAFFRHVTDPQMDKDPDMNEALGDFQLYAAQAGPKLRAAGIDFETASATRFKLEIGKHVRDFRAPKADVGYYFIAPGKEPHVEHGVMTDMDLIEAARKYFGIDSRSR
jgi:hypothetical protein